MTSLLARSSGKTDGLVITKSKRRRNITIIPGAPHNRGTEKAPSSDYKKRHQDLSSIVPGESSFSCKKAKSGVEFSNRPKESSEIKPNPILEGPLYPKSLILTQALKSDLNQSSSNSNNAAGAATGILQPIGADLVKNQKRKLRSQECSKFKSELSAYFPEYDEIIGNKREEYHILNTNTLIMIIDSSEKSNTCHSSVDSRNEKYSLVDYSDVLFTDLNDAERVEFSYLDSGQVKDKKGRDINEDSLSDSYFESIHKKPQRAEKMLRRTDRERAQHDRDQVIRLLEGLKGHDWLKLMGINSVTDTKKREFESARQYFILGCESIIAKFRKWRDQEKQKKVETDVTDKSKDEPGQSESDHLVTKQLLLEATTSHPSLAYSKCRKKQTQVYSPLAIDFFEPYEMDREFKSFFSKPYMREAALRRQRNMGRSVYAWGHPVPDLPEQEFNLPESFRNKETLRAHARRKRRDERIKKKKAIQN